MKHKGVMTGLEADRGPRLKTEGGRRNEEGRGKEGRRRGGVPRIDGALGQGPASGTRGSHGGRLVPMQYCTLWNLH
jgi:hypothetical protein